MTEIQLQQSVLQDVASLLGDTDALKKLQKMLQRLKKEKADREGMTQGEKAGILDDVRDGLRELKLARKGKIKLQTVEEFLDELQD